MRKINWKMRHGDTRDRQAFVNGVGMCCDYENGMWLSSAYLQRCKVGTWFKSLEDCKADCVRLAKQVLEDHHHCLAKIMKSFDLDCEESYGDS
jgi:hypothetical protein